MIDGAIGAAMDGEAKVNIRAVEDIFDRIDGLLKPTETGPAVDLEMLARETKANRDPAGRDPLGPDV